MIALEGEMMPQYIDNTIDSLAPQMTTDRRDFHRYAESRWTEFRTSSLIARRLGELGYEVLVGPSVCKAEERMGLPTPKDLDRHWRRAIEQGGDVETLQSMKGGFTGVIGTLRRGDGPTIALRFDIDALDLIESTDPDHRPMREEFASVNPGVCHACGHDGHAAIGLGVASALASIDDLFTGTVRLIFQPAEEGVSGAHSIVEAGHLDNTDFVISLHLMTGWRVGQIVPGLSGNAATRKFDARIVGRPAHAGDSPETGKNALLAAATAVLNMHALPRHHDGFTRINVGRLLAGSGRNVIAADACLAAEVRGETTELCNSMYKRSVRILQSSAAMHDCTTTIETTGIAGTAKSDDALIQHIKSIAAKSKDYSVQSIDKVGGSDDFTEMMRRVQDSGGQATYIGIGADLHGIGIGDSPSKDLLAAHTGSFDFDERALGLAAYLVLSLTHALAQRDTRLVSP